MNNIERIGKIKIISGLYFTTNVEKANAVHMADKKENRSSLFDEYEIKDCLYFDKVDLLCLMVLYSPNLFIAIKKIPPSQKINIRLKGGNLSGIIIAQPKISLRGLFTASKQTSKYIMSFVLIGGIL